MKNPAIFNGYNKCELAAEDVQAINFIRKHALLLSVSVAHRYRNNTEFVERFDYTEGGRFHFERDDEWVTIRLKLR